MVIIIGVVNSFIIIILIIPEIYANYSLFEINAIAKN
jgi:hypothetical protein